MHVAICGGGVIGACTAYYLTMAGVEVTLIERHAIAGAASGKSGGFLAADWCDGTALAPLAKRSFLLHERLAEEAAADPDGGWGYRRLDTYAAAASTWRSFGERRHADPAQGGLAWLAAGAMLQGQLGTTATTAQITPDAFTGAMAKAATDRGARLLEGEVTGLDLGADGGRLRAVLVEDRPLAADAAVIAMGPWTAAAGGWLPLPRVEGLKGHSILLRPKTAMPAEALFAECEGEDGMVDTPELFPRPDGTVYLCGLGGGEPLPADPAAVATDEAARTRLQAMAAALSPALASAQVLASAACYRPVTRDGLPLMGPVPGVEGAYVATGHGVWGMLNGPASGEAMAGLIARGASPFVDLAPFDPARFL